MTPNPIPPTPVEGELLPCPHCNGKVRFFKDDESMCGWEFLCDLCMKKSIIFADTKEEAFKAWNTRSPSLQERGMEKDYSVMKEFRKIMVMLGREFDKHESEVGYLELPQLSWKEAIRRFEQLEKDQTDEKATDTQKPSQSQNKCATSSPHSTKEWDMKTDKQNLLISHACGWREAFPSHGHPHPETKRGGILLPYYWVNEITHARLSELPKYTSDLNACHEMEKVLSNEQRGVFIDYLANICRGEMSYGPSTAIQKAFFATAPQRCEAFLKTMGKWEE